MDQNIQSLLATILAGQGKLQPQALQQNAPTPMARPQPLVMQPQVMPPARSDRREDGRDFPLTDDGIVPGGKPKPGKGNGPKPTAFEKRMDKIAVKGPTAYTKAIEKNLGLNKQSFGYGKSDPQNFATGMASALTGIPQV